MMKEDEKVEEIEAVKTATKITNIALTLYSTYGVSWKKSEEMARDRVLKNVSDSVGEI